MKPSYIIVWTKVALLTFILSIYIFPFVLEIPYTRAIRYDFVSIIPDSDKELYHLRENVKSHVDLTVNGSPITELLVGFEVDSPGGDPIVARTLRANTSITDGQSIRIVSVTSGTLAPDFTLSPKNSFKVDESVSLSVVIENVGNETQQAWLTANVYDSNNVLLSPLASSTIPVSSGLKTWTFLWSTLPLWASLGNATVYVNAFTAQPRDGGFPYCLEKSSSFVITNRWGETVDQAYSGSQSPNQYASTSRLSPEPAIGKYRMYSSISYYGFPIWNSTEFEVESAKLPPSPNFVWSPSEPYVNQTVTFDASSSTPDNGTIIGYRWDWESDGVYDATGVTNTTKYTTPGTHYVTLNVTDSENLWSTVTKPIAILPPTGPTAGFSYTRTDLTVYFNAQYPLSKPGWNGTGYSPIVSYKWNFGDLNVTTTSVPTLTHVYAAVGLYNVTLNVTDTQGLWDITSPRTINVTTVVRPPWDVNQDGIVDIFDLVAVASWFGSSVPPAPENVDIARDNFIDIFDLVQVASHFGETT